MVKRVRLESAPSARTERLDTQRRTVFSDGLARNAQNTANRLDKLNGELNNMLDDQVIEQATRAGMAAGDAQEFKVLHEDTLAARAYNKSAKQSYLLRLEIDTRNQFDALYEKHQNDPLALKNALEAYRGSKVTEIQRADKELVPMYQEVFDRHARPLIKESHRQQLAVLQEEEIASTMTAVESNIKAVERLASLEHSDEEFTKAVAEERTALVAKLTDIGPSQAFAFEGLEYDPNVDRSGALGPDDMARILSDFDDRTAVARVMGKFSQAQDKQKFLDNFLKSEDSSLSQQQIDRLASSMQADIRSARVEQNARRSLLRDDVNDAIFVMDKGHTFQNYETLLKASSEFPELQEKLIIANEQKELAHLFGQLTPLEQINEIKAIETKINSGEDLTRADVELFERYGKIHADTLTGLDSDPVSFGNTVGLYELQPIDTGKPESLVARSNVAEQLRDRYGIVTHGLTEVEIGLVEQRLAVADSAEKQQIFSTFQTAMTDDQFSSLMVEIAKSQPVHALASSLTTDAPKLSHELVRAQSLVDDPEMKKFLPSKTDYTGAVNDYLGNAFRHDASAMSQVISSALALDLLRRQQAGKLEDFDDDDLEKALEEITGGVFEFNDHKIMSPRRGLTEDSFEDIIDGLQDVDLVQNNVTPLMPNGDKITADMLRDYGHLESVGQSSYLININGFYAQDGQGEPYVLEFEPIMNRGSMGGQILGANQ